MGGFRPDGTGQAQSSPSWRARQETSVLAGGYDRHWPGAAEKGGWTAKGAPCMLACLRTVPFEPASPVSHLAVLASEIEQGKDHHLHLRVHLCGFPPSPFSHAASTITSRPPDFFCFWIVGIPEEPTRSSSFPKKTQSTAGRLHSVAFQLANVSGFWGCQNLGRCINLAARVFRSPVRGLGSKSTRGDLDRVEPRS